MPGRNEVYRGEINYPFLLSHIKALGYEGVFGLEYQPSEEDAISLSKSVRYLEGKP